MADVLTWIDADGTSHELSSSGATVLMQREGLYMPPVELVTEEVPGYAGERVREVRTNAREVSLPLLFEASGESALRTALRAWCSAMRVERGPGQLKVVTAGGDTRYLDCYYAGGLAITEGPDLTDFERWQRVVVTWRASDPYWYEAETGDTYTTADSAGAGASFFPLFPLVLVSSEVLATPTIVNGTAPTWPVWTVAGPASSGFALVNVTTGKRISCTRALVKGDVVTIDTRPGARSIELGDGTNLYSYRTAGDELWPLEPGSNELRIELAGATADTEVTLAYRPAHLSV